LRSRRLGGEPGVAGSLALDERDPVSEPQITNQVAPAQVVEDGPRVESVRRATLEVELVDSGR